MTGLELKIIFKHDKALLSSNKTLSLEQIGLPDPTRKFKPKAYWCIKVLDHIENEKRLFVEILSYRVGATDFSDHQKSLFDALNSIEKITFKSIETNGLLRTLAKIKPVHVYPSITKSTDASEDTLPIETPVKQEPVYQKTEETFFYQ